MLNIEHDDTLLVEWLVENFSTLNASKCYLLIAGHKVELMFASVEDAHLWEEQSANLLGILIESSLKFYDHLKMICKKACQKLIL